ncbi:MAG: hypothetical protein FJZ96_09385 [Chloroflexi bacterium]|nr:hypothetical protein [Chloroflexota bacterium]
MADGLEALLSDLTSGDDPRAEAAALQLAARGPQALAPLETLLHAANPDFRWWAVRSLAQMAHPPLDWLAQALDDEADEVQQCAALALALHPSEAALPGLIRLLAEAEPVGANLAATALAAAGAPAVPPLLAFLETHPPHLARLEAIRALATLKDARAIPSLTAALETDSPAMQYWAEQGLETLGLGMVYLEPD